MTSEIKDILENMTTAAPEMEDYIGEDGLLFQPGDDLLQPGHILFKGLVCHHASSFSVTVQRRPPCASRK